MPLPCLFLSSTFPLPCLYLASALPPPCLYLASTSTLPLPLPSLYLASLPGLYLASALPLPCLYLASTFPLPCLCPASTLPLPCLYLACTCLYQTLRHGRDRNAAETRQTQHRNAPISRYGWAGSCLRPCICLRPNIEVSSTQHNCKWREGRLKVERKGPGRGGDKKGRDKGRDKAERRPRTAGDKGRNWKDGHRE